MNDESGKKVKAQRQYQMKKMMNTAQELRSISDIAERAIKQKGYGRTAWFFHGNTG